MKLSAAEATWNPALLFSTGAVCEPAHNYQIINVAVFPLSADNTGEVRFDLDSLSLTFISKNVEEHRSHYTAPLVCQRCANDCLNNIKWIAFFPVLLREYLMSKI